MIHQFKHFEELKHEIGERPAILLMDAMETMFDTKFRDFRLELRQEIRQMFADQLALHKELFASKEDLANLRSELTGDNASLITEFKGEMAVLRTEFKTEMVTLRTEFKTDIAALRTEFKSEIAALRTEMREGFASLRVEFAQGTAKLESRIMYRMFLFWTGQTVVIFAMLRLLLK